MSKKLLIGLAVAAVIAAGGTLYFFVLKPEDEVTLARNAIEGTGEATCTFTDPDTGDNGTLYAKDGDMRVDIETEVDGKTTRGYVLLKDNVGYIWQAGEEQGFTFDASAAEEVEGVDEDLSLKGLNEEDFKKEYEKNKVSCEGGVDDNLLNVPGNVEFADLSDLGDLQQDQDQDAQQGQNADMPTPEELEQQLRELEQQYNY